MSDQSTDKAADSNADAPVAAPAPNLSELPTGGVPLFAMPPVRAPEGFPPGFEYLASEIHTGPGPALRLMPQGYAFPASAIHPFDPVVLANRAYLTRGYFDEHIVQGFIDRVYGHTLVTYDGLAELSNQVRFCEMEGIEGDYVELGAYKGGCIGIMAMSNLHYGKKPRMIHAFDSFEGLPQPVAQDIDANFNAMFKLTDEQKQGKLETINAVAAGEQYLLELMRKIEYPADKLRIHKGWFQDTVPVAAQEIEKIAVLRLDGDLYESYVVPLAHLYDKVVPGGFIIIDDWIFKGCRDAVTEFFAQRGGMPYLHRVDITVRVIRKPF
ncbi:TylF/MycF family methyltransferase [Sediminicoccus sp. KRV36]|uniref:TylF/MycF family methyltransferase n=1 Tax=Sediminicoccus sp. KRV36 TaxID=3133721 RepID=UPI00200C07F3|nr:TylF/MycF family methyltransferase [Sediminicoccus rosea]UPY36830.1 TylF/MycF family methyltransferase [Sediminicoccus rosea]